MILNVTSCRSSRPPNSFLTVGASASTGVKSIDELVKRARAEPGKLNWAGTAGLPQFAFADFEKGAGLDMVQVSYRDFGPALQDVSEGRINVVSTGLLPMLPLAQSGKVRLLVITNSRRSPAAPDIPTAKEAGFPELAVDGFQGFFGWRGIPDELRDRIAVDVRAVAADPEIEKRLNELGQAVRTGTTADFVAMIKEQRAKITAVAQAIGLQPQ